MAGCQLLLQLLDGLLALVGEVPALRQRLVSTTQLLRQLTDSVLCFSCLLPLALQRLLQEQLFGL